MKVVILFVAIAFAIIAYSDAKVTFKIQNTSDRKLRIGIRGINGREDLANGGFILEVKGNKTVYADDKWAGRFWARTYCNNINSDHCRKLDCANKIQCALPVDHSSRTTVSGTNVSGTFVPATQIIIYLKFLNDNSDSYTVTRVHGYDVVHSIEPVNGQGDGGQYSCKKVQRPSATYMCKANTYKINFGPPSWTN